MTAFEEVLKENGFEFSSILDQAGKDELSAFWDSMAGGGDRISYAELEAILAGYLDVGVIRPVGASGPDAFGRGLFGSVSGQNTEEDEDDRHPFAVAGRLMSQPSASPASEAGKNPEKPKTSFYDPDCAALADLADRAGITPGSERRPVREPFGEGPDYQGDPSVFDTSVTNDFSGNQGTSDLFEAPASDSAAQSAGASCEPVSPAGSPAAGRPDVPAGNSDGRTAGRPADSSSASSGRFHLHIARKDHAPVVTYKVITSNIHEASAEHPIMILSDQKGQILHHQVGDFTNPERRTAFEFRLPDDDQGNAGKIVVADILYIDKRFIKLLQWLGSGHFFVRLSGRPRAQGYAVYKIHAEDPNGNDTLQSANDSFLQFNIRRLLAGDAPETINGEENDRPEDDHMILSDMASMLDFLKISGDTLPPDIRSWAHRNVALVKTDTISPEEKRHAQRALSIMLNIQWKGSYFESVDPKEARRILDEELYGMEKVKQRVIETIIQINRTHTLPAYGLLLVGPAGTGKSQIAYAVARILKLPWAALDMSAIHDPEALTGSPRVYSNAKPGRIMEAFSRAGSSNIVFIINELDKADSKSSSGNPADALLTLLDNLGYTDNYIECVIPTSGVYPIATANDKTRISDPLLTRFAMIEIPDYTPEEKATIFTHFSLPKVLKRLGMTSDEVTVTDEAVDVIIRHYRDVPGVRDLEQAAEHLAANALYRIETSGAKNIVFDADLTRRILEG